MQEERERGRIIGLRHRRLATAEWAASFVPLLAEARRELPIYADTGEPSHDAYARWLTTNGVLTRRKKKTWHSETVRRLFDVHIGLIDEAEREFEIAMAIVRFKMRYADPAARKALATEEETATNERASAIRDALRLSADLRGHTYEDRPVPDRLDPKSIVQTGRPQRRSARQAAEAETARKQISLL
ncbi:hypothetical protein [Sphingomonas sp. IC4-52]|uniref:hypothetical protein n=1 Tax=Sphingomonas sp. IC4-52 TaxID=2887202 RepID=UPI001D11D64C|nr:hypothetical protein [Sphingomonas sp. IC4-52]MCC2981717.1 hypothetical protein [Sphingomonas sp. IC4-52]